MSFVPVLVFHQNHLWSLYQKVTFDPLLKLIYVNAGVTSIDVKIDLYSDLKEWYKLNTNSRIADFGMRSIGGDPTTAGQTAGDIYFMTNGWRVVYDPTKVTVTGVLFSDDYDTAWLDSDTLNPVYPAVVSSLVNTATPSLEGLAIPTATDNATAVRTELTPELATIEATNTIVTNTDSTVNTINSTVNTINSTVNTMNATVNGVDVTLNNVLSIVQEVLKYGKNRSRIDPVNYQMIIYEDDGITELKRYNLKDRNNVASILEIFDKVPVSGSP